MWSAVVFTIQKVKKSNAFLFYLLVVLKTIIGITFILDLYAYKLMIDAANNKIGSFSFFTVLIFLYLYFLGSKFLYTFVSYITNELDIKSLLSLNTAFINKIASLDLSTFENPNTVGLINRAFNRFQFQLKLYFISITQVYVSVIETLISLSIFFFVSPIMGCVVLIANMVPVYVRSKMSYGIFNIYKADDETKRKFGYLSNTLISRETLPEIKLFQAFGFFKQKIMSIYRSFTSRQLKIEQKSVVFVALAELLPMIVIFIFFYYAGLQFQKGKITPGMFVLLFINGMAFFNRLKFLSQYIGDLHSSSLLMKDAIDFFSIKPTVSFPLMTASNKYALIRKLKHPTIRMEDVSFVYPNAKERALSHINLTIAYGENVAIIGENGAGKTSLIKLLLRIYEPTEGNIYINDVNLKDIPERLLFSVYSTLFQSFGKFYFSVSDNLEMAAGKPLKEEEMKRFLKFANAWEFIKNTKGTYNQQLGPEYTDGIDLSGGQWQRLAIARAYAKQSPILILDEPTSAVDAKSEMEIFDRLIKEMERDTLIFISHRFSTIKDAKRIIVLDKGRLIEEGCHEVLMKNKNKYEQLYTIQAQRYNRPQI